MCTKDLCPDGKGRAPFGDNCCSCERKPTKKPTTKPTTKPKKPTPFVIPTAMKKMIAQRTAIRKQMLKALMKDKRYIRAHKDLKKTLLSIKML